MDIAEWWRNQAEQEIEAVIPKAKEYGSADLEIMGVAMAEMLPDTAEALTMTEEQRREMGLEMACAFYLLGKTARMFGAYAKGRGPSDDTWHDAAVYTRMGQYVRENGVWV